MSPIPDPFYDGPQTPKPERQLRELPLSQRPEATGPTGVVTGAQVRDVFDALGYEINRATALINAVEPRAKKLFIPVDRDATNVRQAIRRRVPGSTGDQIPFALYKDMLDLKVKLARSMKFEIVGELTGDILSDGVKIKRFMKTGGKGLSSWEEFLLSREQFGLWMLLNQLLGNFSCVEHQEVCAAKNPPGTETGPVTMRHAIAIAAMMLILGLQEDHVMFAVQQPADALGVPPVDIINRARRLVQTDLHRELTETIGASDPQAIIDYCDNYIARNPIGYEDWFAYRDLRQIREYAVITYYHAHQYSKEYSTLLDFTSVAKHTTPSPSLGFSGLLGVGPRAVVENVDPANTIALPQFHYDAMVNQVAGIDRSLASIAGVLTSWYSLDALCCIGRFLGNEDVKRLKRLRSVLAIAQSVITNGLAANVNDPGTVMDMIISALEQELITFLERYFDKVATDVIDFMGETDSDTWNDLFNCPLIEDLLVYIVNAIQKFQEKLFSYVRNFANKTFGFHDRIYRRWGELYDARRLQTIISILDRLIAAIEVCADLEEPGDDGGGTEQPNPGDDPGVYTGVPQPLVLPPDVIQKFFRNPAPVLRPDGARPIPPVGQGGNLGDPVSTKNFRDICRGILPDELLDAIAKGRS